MTRYLVLAGALLIAATDVSAQSIWVDQEDYAPLDLVTFTGTGFADGETVSLVATGSKNGTVITAEAIAALAGDITGSFALPNVFEPTYHLVATGLSSGLVAEVVFIDNFNLNNFSPVTNVTLACTGGNTTVSQTFTVGTNANGTNGESIYWELDGDLLSPNTVMAGGSSSRTLSDLHSSFVLRASSTEDFSSIGQRTRTWNVTVNGCSQPVSVGLSDLDHDYDGTPKAATVDTDPFVTTAVTYNGSGSPPTNAGSYNVVATVNQTGYAGSATGTLVINKVDASVIVEGGTFEYDGTPRGAAGSALGVLGEDLSGLLNLGASFTDVPGGTAGWSFAGDTNYNPASGTADIAITPAPAVVDVTGGLFTYDALPHSATVATTPFGLAVDVTYDGSATPPVNAGVYPVDVSVTNPNYEGLGSGVIEIERADQTIEWDTPANIVYGTPLTGAQLNAMVTGVAGGTPPGALVYTPAAGALLDAGLHALRVDAEETTNYNAAYYEVSLQVDRATQFITFDPLPDRTYGDADFALVASSSALLPVSFFASGDCTVSGGMVSITGAGSCTITASQDGDTNYEAAASVDQTFSIDRALAVIVVAGGTFVYDGTPYGATGTATGVFSEDLSGLLDLGDAFTDVPGGTANWTFAGDANYYEAGGSANIEITPATQVIDFGALADRTYGDAPFTVFATGGGSTSDVVFSAVGDCSVAIDEVTILGAGSCTVTANQAGDSNHFAAAPVEETFSIDRANLSVTAEDQDKVYDGLDFSPFTATFDGFVYSDDESSLGGTLVFGGSAAGATGAGTYSIVPSGLTSDDYDIAFVPGTLTIDRAQLSITASSPVDIEYGDAAPAVAPEYDGFVGGESFANLLAAPLCGTAYTPGDGIGPYATSCAGAASDNYEISYLEGSFNVLPRQIAISADPQTKVYGEDDPAVFTYQITGGSLFAGDAFAGALSRAPGEDVGLYDITLGSLDLGPNYDLDFTGATLEITQRPVTVAADAGQTKVYGFADPAFSYQITVGSIAFGDPFTGALEREAGEDVGLYEIFQGSLTLGDNYALTFLEAQFEITVRPITVTADPQTKVYGDDDPDLTYLITDGSLAFTDAFAGELDREAGEDVGLRAITQGTLDLSDNYLLSFIGASLEITHRPISVTADSQTKVYGDDDPALTYEVGGMGLAFSDAFTGALERVAGETVLGGPYAINQGTLLLTDNYTLSFFPGSLDITPKSAAVTPAANGKTYGDPDPALTGDLDGFLAGDGVTATYTRDAGENVAEGPYTISATLDPAGVLTNYDIAYNTALFSISPASLTVTADDQEKVYDGDVFSPFTVDYAGFVFSEDPSYLGGALTFGEATTAVDAGTYDIEPAGLTSTNYDITFVGADLEITRRPIDVTADPQTKVYGEVDPALTYVSSETLIAGNAFTGALTRAPGEDVDTYAIEQGNLSAGGNYDITFFGDDFEITQRPVTVTADPKTKVYGEADPALTYAITLGNTVFGDDFSGALTRVAGETVGDWAIEQGSLTLGPNYALSYVGDDLTITHRMVTITADPQTKIYGEDDPDLTYQITTGSLAFDDAFIGELARDAGQDVGPYAINQHTVELNDNYVLSYVGADLTITERPITVTADAQAKTYGDDDPALTYQISSGSLAYSDAFAGALIRESGEDVGDYEIQQGSLSLSTNYLLSYVPADLTIGQRAIEVTADAGQTKVYGESDPAAFAYAITDGNLVFGDLFSGELTRVAGEDVGDYAIEQGTLALSTNYALTYFPADFSITRRPVTITPDAGQGKVYGNVDPALTFTPSEALLPGNAFTGVLVRAAGEDVGTYVIGLGTLEAGGNYLLSLDGAAVTFAISQRPVTVAADPKTKTYGDADPALTYQITSGTLAFEDEFAGALSRESGENVGLYAIQQNTLTLGSNYDLSYTAANLEITHRLVTVTADAKTKVYGDADPALTYQITSGTLAFSDSFSGGLAREAGENVSSYAIQQNTLALNANYVLSYAGATFSITQRPITVTADSHTKLLGASDPGLTYEITSGNLAFSDAFSGALTRAPGEAVGNYAILQGTLTAGGNYALTYVPGNLWITYGAPSQYLPPMSGIPTVAIRAQRNRTVPIKFELPSLPGYAGAEAHISLFHLSGSTATAVIVELGTGPSDGGTLFRYTGGQYMYNLGTRNLAPGLYRVLATLADGQPPIEGLIEVVR